MATANASTPFDETARRRPSFDPDSVPVDLGAATLYLPKPRVEIRFRAEGGRLKPSPVRSFGADFDALTEAVIEASSGLPHELAGALADLALDLIGRNYDLSAEEVAGLLVFVPAEFVRASIDGDGLPEPWDTVWRIAVGLPPKPNAPGPTPPASSPGSTPTA